MSDPVVVPEGVDPDRPNAARMYDFYLGGCHNFAADRAAAAEVVGLTPLVRPMARSNRAWMQRVVRHLVRDEGVRQVLDLGSGIPSVGNVHEVAFALAADSVVAYVDVEAVAVAHSRLLLAGEPRAMVVQEDIRRPSAVVEAARSLVDFRRPVLVMMSSVLPFVPGEPSGIVDAYLDAVTPGSFLAVSHASRDGLDPALLSTVDRGAEVYARAEQPVTLRTYVEIARWFDRLTLLAPGLVRLERWRPEQEPVGELPMIAYGGVGQVP